MRLITVVFMGVDWGAKLVSTFLPFCNSVRAISRPLLSQSDNTGFLLNSFSLSFPVLSRLFATTVESTSCDGLGSFVTARGRGAFCSTLSVSEASGD